MKNSNTFTSKSKLEIESESLLYINRKLFRQPPLSNDENQAVEEIRRDGFTCIANFIDKKTLTVMQNILNNDLADGCFEMPALAQSKIDPQQHRDLINNYLLGNGKTLKEKGIAFDHEDFDSLEQCISDFRPSTLKSYYSKDSAIYFQTMLSAKIRRIIEGYMGIKPYLIEGYSRRNFPASYTVMNHHWHRDTNNKLFLVKAFLFLTDCDVKNGPHHYIRGSHKDFGLLNGKQYYTDKEIASAYPSRDDLIISKVKAGTLILEDTRGLHKAGVPEEGFRDLVYGIYFPVKFFARWKNSYYQIPKKIYDQLDEAQRSYIPLNCLV